MDMVNKGCRGLVDTDIVHNSDDYVTCRFDYHVKVSLVAIAAT